MIYCQAQSQLQVKLSLKTEDGLEDDLNCKEDGRRPQFVRKRKATSICWQGEDNLRLLATERRP
jgi:hypothetical protein